MTMRYPRKTNPKVRNGKVQKKNRTDLSPHYNNYTQDRLVIDRLRPGAGYRHLLRKPDVSRFIELLPDWAELSRGLDAIVLAPGSESSMGWYSNAVVAVSAWPKDLAGEYDVGWVDEHRPILDRLGVPLDDSFRNRRRVCWTRGSARAFQLMHVLLHELGHHHDLMTTASQRASSRGEGYAEAYALKYSEGLWEKYFTTFGSE